MQEKIPISKEEKQNNDIHFHKKFQTRIEKRRDIIGKTENKILVVFDLENVVTLPNSDAGSFFLKSYHEKTYHV